MMQVFDECRVSASLDPLDGRKVDFPFEEVFAALDGATSRNALSGDELQRMAAALGETLRWIVGLPKDRHATKGIARRAVALTWIIAPDQFDGKSLASLARKLGIPKNTMVQSSGEASRRFGVRSRGQQHAALWRKQHAALWRTEKANG